MKRAHTAAAGPERVSRAEVPAHDTAETPLHGYADTRPAAVAQRRMAAAANGADGPSVQRRMAADANAGPGPRQQRALAEAVAASPRQVAQRASLPPNRTGLPDRLKSGVESLSGMSMDSVRVHYNSSRPAALGAHAYAQGTDIHLGAGQERHLPHEAWHVVQQAQGRVQPTLQMRSGTAVNDARGLEYEADVMGARALALPPAPTYRTPGAPPVRQLRVLQAAAPVIQMVKFIVREERDRRRTIVSVPDDYRLTRYEYWAKDRDILLYRSARSDLDAQARRRTLERKQDRARRMERAERSGERNFPNRNYRGKQINFPRVLDAASGRTADLVYRGMSMNNILNLNKADAPPVFTAQKPEGTANIVRHIVDDSEDSPYLSFETGGLGISAGKYAAKPLDPDTLKPHGVEVRPGGFLKQEKSYTVESRRRYPGAVRIGYVGGIPSNVGSEQVDLSTESRATRELSAVQGETAERRDLAKKLALADKEYLVKPGRRGVARAQVPFVAKVKEVPEAYYRKHLVRQTAKKRLGYYSQGGNTRYSKIQIPPGQAFQFDLPPYMRRTDSDSEGEMSEIEDMNLQDYEGPPPAREPATEAPPARLEPPPQAQPGQAVVPVPDVRDAPRAQAEQQDRP